MSKSRQHPYELSTVQVSESNEQPQISKPSVDTDFQNISLSAEKTESKGLFSRTTSIRGHDIKTWILVLLAIILFIIVIVSVLVSVVLVIRNKHENGTAETQQNPSTTTVSTTTAGSTNEYVDWSGTFAVNSSNCNQSQCCCIIDVIYLERSTLASLVLTTTLGGQLTMS
ncbi:unnamed protein product [Adineta ricciae]|uniref:Uncharacterized protein n=1 Tax=Adineta ricciae TaxID=249248 RepID=A0A815A3D5_ADIRI|nr:unnamed protein product [Adineta ricciae]